ncbi:MAG: hypothetical protein JSV65_11740 [Armatimonadota bacterium]|nr:MAG: hypothetical protein JSV65_11740 [Armatimonadota bacterium]
MPRHRGRGCALLTVIIAACSTAVAAGALPYRFETFRFPDCPRTVVGVAYRAGDANSTVPLGGLGTGTVYFDSLGRFTGQAIANSYRPVGGVMEGCEFVVRTESAGRVVDKPLAELVRAYLGHFPIADLECAGDELPVAVRVRAMSPFILRDARASATPAAMFRFAIDNTSEKPVKTSVTFRWRTPLQADGGGARAEGNVGGFLVWNLGDLAPGAQTAVPVAFAAVDSIGGLSERLKAPAGDLVVDDDGAFNWEDEGKQCLTTAAGGCLSQHGFYLHYILSGRRRAGTLIRGAQRLENLTRAGREDGLVRLASTDGALAVEVRSRSGAIEYEITNVGSAPIRDLRLSVYANLEAGNTESDDAGRLDARRRALVVGDATGAACGLASERSPNAGWCGTWDAAITRMREGDAVPFREWQPVAAASHHRRTSTTRGPTALFVTRENTPDRGGCTVAVLPGAASPDGAGRFTRSAGRTPGSPETVAVTGTLHLKPGRSGELRFVLAWFYPDARDSAGRFVGHQYANWFDGSLAVAKHVAGNWDWLARRVGEWQDRIYDDPRLPDWLKDQLVNSLYSLARNTSWLKDGRFTHSESFVGCPITETIVCRFYGSIPIAAFFPELEKNTMRQFIRHQRGDGAIPFAFGGGENWDAPYYETQQIINSSEFVLMARRDYFWWHDREWAGEVYPAVKKAVAFARTLDTDGDGLINDELSRQYYDCWQFHGAASYTGGIWLAALKAAAALAQVEGDNAFREECEALFEQARASFERKLWTGSYYRLWHDTAANTRSDTCLAAQLTGQWYAYLCGLGEILSREHVIAALEHINRANGAGDVWALVNGVTPDGSRDTTGTNGHSHTATLGETWCYAATCIYAGRPDLGLPRAQRLAENIALRQRRTWDTTWNLDPDSGDMLWGREYYSNMCVWDLWGALVGRRVTPVERPPGPPTANTSAGGEE